MTTIITWVAVGLLALFLLVGLICGLVRGLKRSSLHLLFFLASAVLAYFITKPIAQAILNIEVSVDGGSSTISELIVTMVRESFDLSNMASVETFLQNLPKAEF